MEETGRKRNTDFTDFKAASMKRLEEKAACGLGSG
jgi:hypothetical protein